MQGEKRKLSYITEAGCKAGVLIYEVRYLLGSKAGYRGQVAGGNSSWTLRLKIIMVFDVGDQGPAR